MNIKNLERAAQIAEQLPLLERARNILSKSDSSVGVLGTEERVVLPHTINYNVLSAVNAEINLLKKEVGEL